MQSTGQTSRHCGTSKWPTHSVHLRRVDHVDLGALRDRVVRALGLADVAVDAFVGDHQRHGVTLVLARRAHAGLEALVDRPDARSDDTSPPNFAISRTIVADTNVYCSDGRQEQRFDIRDTGGGSFRPSGTRTRSRTPRAARAGRPARPAARTNSMQQRREARDLDVARTARAPRAPSRRARPR